MDVSAKSSYGGSAILTVIGALTLQQWAAVIGIIIAIGTFFVNMYFKKKMLDKTEAHYRETERIQREKDEAEE